MATKTATKPPTAAEIQRALGKKYGVIGCPIWFDFFAAKATLDGVPIPTGTEIVFKTEDGTVCGAGVFFAPGMMRFSPCYADDRYAQGKTGAGYGEKIFIWVTSTTGSNGISIKRLNYSPVVQHPWCWMRVELTALRTV
jgi:hypothetical protein